MQCTFCGSNSHNTPVCPERGWTNTLHVTTTSHKAWVVVQHAGLTTERIVAECRTYDDALCAQGKLYAAEERAELGIDIMKRLPDGGLTTEY